MPAAWAQRDVSARRGSRFVLGGYLAKLATSHHRQQSVTDKGGLCDLIAERIGISSCRDPHDVSFPLVFILDQEIESGYPLLLRILSRDYLPVGFSAHCWLQGKEEGIGTGTYPHWLTGHAACDAPARAAQDHARTRSPPGKGQPAHRHAAAGRTQ